MANLSRTLVTGFGPFAGIAENPSQILARESGRDHEVLEVSFEAVDEFLYGVDPQRFDRLLLIGVAAGREFMTPELFGRNFTKRLPDVRGNYRWGDIEPSGELLLLCNIWDPKELAHAFLGQPMRVSQDAGGYLCNYICYRAIRRFPDKEVGFLHVPPFARIPSEQQLRVLENLIRHVESS
jgi:pyroglutamyl-peptidase